MSLSYLLSTAGHAQQQNETNPHKVSSILQLVDEGADEFEDEAVVGFTSYTDRWTCDCYSFREIARRSSVLAHHLKDAGVLSGSIVSLLCPTGVEFLLAWIGLMRLGYGVVFIAPQCAPSAIVHLLESTNSSQLIYHSKYADLAKRTRSHHPPTSILLLPSSDGEAQLLEQNVDPQSVSHVFHTSGTSGTPKPILNTHIQTVSVLPRRAIPKYIDSSPPSLPPSESAAFTTTPLFHGGVSDLLRAWMARSMIYFYPTSDVPITADNVVAAVKSCSQELTGEEERRFRFRVSSFLSVPYILSILASNSASLALLRSMEMVSTGGAPLEPRIGETLVLNGVKLVSRLGSSECGFLLSSHRDYEKESDWDWLRNDSVYADALIFEPVEDRYEMVVSPRWSSLTKSNRANGSYATGDLYEKHPVKPGVWRYSGRADDVIVLSTGEKASPGTIESILREKYDEALVVGSNRTHLGVVLFADAGISDQALASLLNRCNESSPSFAQISSDIKGTVQRGLAYEMFSETIDNLYDNKTADAPRRDLPQIRSAIRAIILQASCAPSDKSIEDTTDLFSWGVDSLKATRIRSAMQMRLFTGRRTLPSNIVFEKPSVERLARYVFSLQESVEDEVDHTSLVTMRKFVDDYGSFTPVRSQTIQQERPATIILTGGTGELGSFLTSRLTTGSNPILAKLVCLVRADSDALAMRRLQAKLRERKLPVDLRSLEVYAAKLSEPRLGLRPEVYQSLSQNASAVIHAGWPVNFAMNLVSFEDSIRGVRNLLEMVGSNDLAKFYYCSSLASVLAQSTFHVRERPSGDPETASPIGYSQSKWVAERICQNANENVPGRVHILRIGQLCGDTDRGAWNEREGWPLLIRTAQTVGYLPDLQEKLSWLPVDLAAQVIIDIVAEPADKLVYHIVHPRTVYWTDLLAHFEASGLSFERASPAAWLNKIEGNAHGQEDKSNQMLPLWKAAYGHGSRQSEPEIETANAEAASATLRTARAVDSAHVAKMVGAWRRSGFLE